MSATEAKQNLAALIDAAQREPVVVRRHDRDVAVVLSPQEYDRLRGANVDEYLRIAKQFGQYAAEQGMDEQVLDRLLKDKDATETGH